MSTTVTAPDTAEPLVVDRFDVAMEPAPEEPPVLTIGAVAVDGRPVALLLDRETRAKVARWLVPEVDALRARVAELEAERAAEPRASDAAVAQARRAIHAANPGPIPARTYRVGPGHTVTVPAWPDDTEDGDQ